MEHPISPKWVLLDRDGVINRDSDAYVKRWAEFAFLPRSLAALRVLAERGIPVVVVTNQSAIGRGLTTAAAVARIHERMRAAVAAAGGRIRAVYHCPHAPGDGCRCRKPEPGLVERACRELGLRAADAVLVGDDARDVDCARAAGCKAAVLVRTGKGAAAEGELAERGTPPDRVAADLYDAVQWIVG
jgi:D-glycero-D-manno-heptose 1,7-bisphosphate phosphatase